MNARVRLLGCLPLAFRIAIVGIGIWLVRRRADLDSESMERADAEREIERLRRIEEAARAMCDEYAHFSDCYPVGPCTCGLDALRAALEEDR